jgi:hypothetical protein
MFSWQHCPLFQSKLSWPMRIMYSSGVWSYVVGAISTPTFIIIPCVTIWFGVFPIVVSQWAALGVTVYYFATNMVSPAPEMCFWRILTGALDRDKAHAGQRMHARESFGDHQPLPQYA